MRDPITTFMDFSSCGPQENSRAIAMEDPTNTETSLDTPIDASISTPIEMVELADSTADVPPLPGYVPYTQVTKRRIQRVRSEGLITVEGDKLEDLFIEGEAIKGDTVRFVDAIEGLRQKQQMAEKHWRASLIEFTQLQKNSATLGDALVGIKARWAEDALLFNGHTDKLKKLQMKKSQLEDELRHLSKTCTLIADRVSAALVERERLESLLVRIEESSVHASTLSKRKDTEIQKEIDSATMLELSDMHEHLVRQVNAVKNVRETIELLKRCS